MTFASPNREFRRFAWKDTNVRIHARSDLEAWHELVRQRRQLEAYLAGDTLFKTALKPVSLQPNAPEVAQRMHAASVRTGVGPMAAVAGTLAQFAAEEASRIAGGDVIVENGGDLFVKVERPVRVGLFTGAGRLGGRLAFLVQPCISPVAVCSSSSRMGHSVSFGACDLATVVAPDAALADAAATLLCNSVRSRADLEVALERVVGIPGIRGALAVVGEALGIKGNLPKLVPGASADTTRKITRDPRAGLMSAR